MTEPFDDEAAALKLTDYILEVLHPPAKGASVRAHLGAHIFKAILRDAGYAIVPLTPTTSMVSAFRRGWFRKISDRYDAMLSAAWPDVSRPKKSACSPRERR